MVKRKPVNKGKRTPKRRKSRMALRNKADRLFSLMVRERDGWECRVCGSIDRITCGHLVSRSYHAVRWAPENAVAQCWPCNVKAKHDPIWWEDWIEEHFPGRLKLLKARARQGIKTVNLEEVVEALTGGRER